MHQNMTGIALCSSLMVGIKVFIVGWVQNDDLSKMPFLVTTCENQPDFKNKDSSKFVFRASNSKKMHQNMTGIALMAVKMHGQKYFLLVVMMQTILHQITIFLDWNILKPCVF